MEKTLQRIANLLILNIQNIERLGLLNGKMGLIVFLYHYARHASQTVYSDQADDLLDELFAVLNTGSVPPLLETDVAGIGFGLNHLIENRFIATEGSPDELLKDVDMRLSQDVNKLLRLEMERGFPIFTLGFYILSRIKTGRRNTQKNKLISLSLTGIHAIYINKKHAINPTFTNSVIHCLNGMYNHGVYKNQVRKVLKAILDSILAYSSTTNYHPADINILQNLLSSVQTNVELVNKLLAQTKQFRTLSDDNIKAGTDELNLRQYMLYPNIDNPDSFTSLMEKYIDNYIAESEQSDFSLLPYMGLHLMGVKLC